LLIYNYLFIILSRCQTNLQIVLTNVRFKKMVNPFSIQMKRFIIGPWTSHFLTKVQIWKFMMVQQSSPHIELYIKKANLESIFHIIILRNKVKRVACLQTQESKYSLTKHWWINNFHMWMSTILRWRRLSLLLLFLGLRMLSFI